MRAEPNGFLVHHLSHSVTLSSARQAELVDTTRAPGAVAAAHVHLPGPCRQSRHHTCRGVAAQSPAVGADGGTGAYVQACAHVPALSLSCVRARMHARAPTCMLTRTLARTRPHAHAHAHAHTRTHAHTHTRAQTHEPTHTAPGAHRERERHGPCRDQQWGWTLSPWGATYASPGPGCIAQG